MKKSVLVPKCRYRHLGTSLLLLLPRPMRLSTDIDIVVKPGTDIDFYIEKAKVLFPFKDGGEQNREKKSAIIQKRHFEFIYDSQISAPDTLHILLDVLFEENQYQRLIRAEINNEMLLTEGENLFVTIPTLDCILGDKLTAFAPHTTGINFGEKNLEIMKQFFDINLLIDELTNFQCVFETYKRISETEIRYRGIECSPQKALLDTIASAVCIGSRGKTQKEEYLNFLEGSRKLTNHIYEKGFSMEKASRMAPKVIYLATCLLTETPFERVTDSTKYSKEALVLSDFMGLKDLKKVDPTGYSYLIKADKLLNEYRKRL